MPGSWSDFLKLRSGPAPPPSSEAGAVRVYADADGALRSVQSDGTDEPIGGGGMFNGGTITTPLIITPTDGTADPLEVNLQFDESFVFSTTGGGNNIVYFKDASNGHPIEITDSNVKLGGSSFIAPQIVVQDSSVGITLPTNKRLIVTDGGTLRFVVSPTYVKFHQTAAPDDGDLDAGDCALWLDQTNGAAKLMIKGKSANGTVVTGSVVLV